VRVRHGGEVTIDRIGFEGARVGSLEEARDAVRDAIRRAKGRAA